MNTKIVTNLRIDQHDWQQLKIMATELGMSANEYVAMLVREQTTRASFAPLVNNHASGKVKKYSIWRPWEISEGVEEKPMGASTEDASIYYI